MTQGKTLIMVSVTLVIGFGAGFTLRPVILPVAQTAGLAPTAVPAEPRATQYFAAHLDEARQLVAQCTEGTVRGAECTNAEQAVVEADGKDRFRRFMGK